MKQARKSVVWAVLAASLATLPGCGSAAGEPVGEPAGDPNAASALIHRTIVVNNEDGTTTVRRLDIPLSEHLRDIELRTLLAEGKYTPAVNRDYSCAASSMWLFTGPNLSGDELCLYQSPKSEFMSTEELWRWDPYGPLYQGPSWVSKIRSFWGGSEYSSKFNWAGGCCSGPGNCSEGSTSNDVIGCGPWIPACTEYYGSYARRDTVSTCVSVAKRIGLQAYSHF